MQVVAELAAIEPMVCRPISLDGQLLRLGDESRVRNFSFRGCMTNVRLVS